jgi:hypothetical protein
MATINTTDPKPGFVYDTETDTWFPLAGIAVQSLDGLTDVVITSAATSQVLKYDGTNWINGSDEGLPSQTGNDGKYLTTDGSTASWGSVTTDPTPTVFLLMGA